MNNNLPIIKQEAKVILGKSNSLIKITNKILAIRSSALTTTFLYKPFIQIGHADSVFSVAFSPDGKTALSGSYDNTLKLWDISTGKVIRTFEGHTNWVFSVAFSPDGKTALSGSRDKTLKLWDISTGKEIRTFEGHTNLVFSVAFSPDGKTALLGSRWEYDDYYYDPGRGTLKLWDISTGKEIQTFEGHTNCVLSVAFSPDGKTALSGSNNTLKLWDISTGKEIRIFRGHRDGVYSVAFSPDGKTALSGSWDKTLKLWDISTGKEIRTFEGHTDSVNSVAFSPDGKTAFSGSDDKTLKLWDISTGKEIQTFKGHRDGVYSVAFSPDGKTALSGSRDKTLKLWDISTGKVIRTFEGHTGGVSYDVPVTADGKMALSGSWDISTGKDIRTLISFRDDEWVTITPDGYFDHSKNGRQYLNVLTSPMSADTIDDATYNHYYRPNGLLKSNDLKLDIDEYNLPF